MPGDCVVYVVDNNAGVRRSLGRPLMRDGLSVRSFDSATFFSVAPTLPRGCILLEVRRPEMQGLELQERLVACGVGHPFVIVTGHGDVPAAVRAMKAGAVDVLEKSRSYEDILRAIESALEEQNQKGAAPERRDAAEATRLIGFLSPREREVLNALAAGIPNKVIAFNLGISVRTVEVHRARMMKRLGVRQFADAIRIAVLATRRAVSVQQDHACDNRAWPRG